MMWGSILALWGTAGLVAASSRGLGIKRVSLLYTLLLLQTSPALALHNIAR